LSVKFIWHVFAEWVAAYWRDQVPGGSGSPAPPHAVKIDRLADRRRIGGSEMPYKEEDEGYLAAETGPPLADNPYPAGTIRHAHWRRGWHIRSNESHTEEHDGYLAAAAGEVLSNNPYPRGTIRYEQWRRGWHIKRDEILRAIRLGRK
jgi:hypothetical protein